MNNKAAAHSLVFLGICIMVASCFAAVTILPGLGFGGLLVVAGISLNFSSDQTTSHMDHDRSRYGSRENLAGVSAGLVAHRQYDTDDVIVTSVVYGDFDLLVTYSADYGYCISIDGFDDRDSERLAGYRTVDDALASAKRVIDDELGRV